MRTSITAGLKKRLKDLMSEFTELRKRVQQEYREVVERRVHAVTGRKVGEEEIDRIIETGEGETVFQQALLNQGKGKVWLYNCTFTSSKRIALFCKSCFPADLG